MGDCGELECVYIHLHIYMYVYAPPDTDRPRLKDASEFGGGVDGCMRETGVHVFGLCVLNCKNLSLPWAHSE